MQGYSLATEKIAFDSIKIVGIAGAVIGFIGLLIDEFVVNWPPIGLILWFVGLVVTYIAVSRFSKAVNNIKIKQRYEWFLVFSGILLFVTLVLRPFLEEELKLLFVALYYGTTEIATKTLRTLILALFVVYILWILSAKAFKDTYDLVKKHTNIRMFRVVGLTYFIGAIFTIVVMGKYIVMLALLLHIIAWAQLPQYIAIDKYRQYFLT